MTAKVSEDHSNRTTDVEVRCYYCPKTAVLSVLTGAYVVGEGGKENLISKYELPCGWIGVNFSIFGAGGSHQPQVGYILACSDCKGLFDPLLELCSRFGSITGDLLRQINEIENTTHDECKQPEGSWSGKSLPRGGFF